LLDFLLLANNLEAHFCVRDHDLGYPLQALRFLLMRPLHPSTVSLFSKWLIYHLIYFSGKWLKYTGIWLELWALEDDAKELFERAVLTLLHDHHLWKDAARALLSLLSLERDPAYVLFAAESLIART
jgi:hypothetical protein